MPDSASLMRQRRCERGVRFRRVACDANVTSVTHASHEIPVGSIDPAIRGTIQDGRHTRERIASGDLGRQAGEANFRDAMQTFT
jgi:hypothetical protein